MCVTEINLISNEQSVDERNIKPAIWPSLIISIVNCSENCFVEKGNIFLIKIFERKVTNFLAAGMPTCDKFGNRGRDGRE